jgi:uncharacterized protein (DUF2147 family)
MKQITTIISLLFFTLFSSLMAQESAIVATWWNVDTTSHIRIFKATNGKYYGKIEYLKNEPDRVDHKNPDPAKQKDPLLGLMILKGFTYDATKKQWTGGTIYDPDNGKTYDCFMWFQQGTDILYIKGYVLGMKFIGRETQWTRVRE